VAAARARPDRWSERTVALQANAKASPVLVAVWESGVDLALFKTLPVAAQGLAYTADWQPSTDLRHLKQAVAALKPEQLKGFQEDLTLGLLYTHYSHVAGIATAGNPFARVFAATVLFHGQLEPLEPTEPTGDMSRRTAAAYQRTVDAMKAAGVRVVNMSWRYVPGSHEAALTFHNVGKDADERKQMAMRLFAIERDALRAAIVPAPAILFVAGSGNENDRADFSEYIPTGLELANLITVGAVDRSGEETAFSTFGKTVKVHANGFAVDSLLPGADRARFSGTSMAAPQVSNLAAKLIAVEPQLTPVQVKQLILANAEKRGRVNLIHPKATLAALAALAKGSARAGGG